MNKPDSQWRDSRLNPELHSHLMDDDELSSTPYSEEPEDTCPPIDASLVEWLLRNHPRHPYEPTMTLSSICYDEGKQAMIQLLQTQLDLQNLESR